MNESTETEETSARKEGDEGISGLHLFPVPVHVLLVSFPFALPLTKMQDYVAALISALLYCFN